MFNDERDVSWCESSPLYVRQLLLQQYRLQQSQMDLRCIRHHSTIQGYEDKVNVNGGFYKKTYTVNTDFWKYFFTEIS